MSKVLITGGAGFIGSHIVDKCIENGYNVSIVDNLSTGKKEFINRNAKFYHIDICEEEICSVIKIEQPDVIIHHAAQIDVQASLKNPLFDAQVNVLGTINLLKAAVENNVQRIIYASSAAAYGVPQYIPIDENHRKEPISFYGFSKYAPEYYIRMFANLYGIEYVILRYANVYGIRQDPKGEGGVISIFTDKVIKEEPFIVFGDGMQTRDFIYVDDVAEANALAITCLKNQTFNISTATTTTILELIDMFKKVSGQKIDVIHKEERKGDILHSCLDNSHAIQFLRWKPNFSLFNGLKNTYDYYSAR